MIAILLMTAGTAFLLIAAIGVIRLRDPLQRMHSATKSGTLGTTLLLAGVMATEPIGVSTTGLLTIAFLLLTLPIGAQLLGRASYTSGVPLEGLADDPLDSELERADQPVQ